MIIAYGSGGKLISSRWFSVGISHVFEIRWWLGLESSKLPFICLLLVPRSLKLVEWENWSLVQLLSRVWFFVTPWTAAYQASLSFTISLSLLKVMSIESAVQPSRHLSHPSSLALNLSQHHSLFPQISSSNQRAKVLELQHQSFQWIFRIDFL